MFFLDDCFERQDGHQLDVEILIRGLPLNL